jgi:hypothetical protein
MLGYGGGTYAWGLNNVTEIDQSVTPDGYTYVSNDFYTHRGTFTDGSNTITNNAQLIGGDSGGGDFIYNTTTGLWELAGINEVTGTDSSFDGQTNVPLSGFIQLNTYAAEINGIVATPEPTTWALLSFGLVFIWGYLRHRHQG